MFVFAHLIKVYENSSNVEVVVIVTGDPYNCYGCYALSKICIHFYLLKFDYHLMMVRDLLKVLQAVSKKLVNIVLDSRLVVDSHHCKSKNDKNPMEIQTTNVYEKSITISDTTRVTKRPDEQYDFYQS